MTKEDFHDEYTLSEKAEELAKKAVQLGIFSGFVMRYFADSRQFYIPDETHSEPLTPEQAYLHLKKLLTTSAHR